MNRALAAAEEGRSFNELPQVMRHLLRAERERERIKNEIKAGMRNRVVEGARQEGAKNERRAAATRRRFGRRLNRTTLPGIAENEEKNKNVPDEEEIAAVMGRAGTTRAEAIKFLHELDQMGAQAVNAEVSLQRLREVYNGRTANNMRRMLRNRRRTRRRRGRNV